MGPAGADERDSASPWPKNLRLNGRVKEEFAYRLHDPADVSKIRTLAWIDAKYEVSPQVSFRAEGRVWRDAVFLATDRYPNEVRDDQELDLSPRRGYALISAGPFDVRVGQQQVVWGEALGTFVADVVNARDLREFVLPDFVDIRIPLVAIDATYYVAEGVTVEGVWTPDVRFNKVGKPGSEFAFFRFPLDAPGPVSPQPARLDEREGYSLARSEGGGRLSWLVGGWDLALIYYDRADPIQVNERREVPQAAGPPVTLLVPRHPRIHILGATVTKSIEPVVVKSEVTYTIGKLYETRETGDQDGLVRRDTLDYLVGLDYTFFKTLDATFQLSQKVLTGRARGVQALAVEDQVTTTMAVRLATGFLDNTLNPSVLVVVNRNRGDYRVSSRIDYLATASVTLSLGADLFGGPVDTLFGQFHDSDRVYLELSWKF